MTMDKALAPTVWKLAGRSVPPKLGGHCVGLTVLLSCCTALEGFCSLPECQIPHLWREWGSQTDKVDLMLGRAVFFSEIVILDASAPRTHQCFGELSEDCCNDKKSSQHGTHTSSSTNSSL